MIENVKKEEFRQRETYKNKKNKIQREVETERKRDRGRGGKIYVETDNKKGMNLKHTHEEEKEDTPVRREIKRADKRREKGMVNMGRDNQKKVRGDREYSTDVNSFYGNGVVEGENKLIKKNLS